MTKRYKNTGKKLRIRFDYYEHVTLTVWESHTGVKLVKRTNPCTQIPSFYKLRKNKNAGKRLPGWSKVEPAFESSWQHRYEAPETPKTKNAARRRSERREQAIEKLKASLTKVEIKALFTPECGAHLLRLSEVL